MSKPIIVVVVVIVDVVFVKKKISPKNPGPNILDHKDFGSKKIWVQQNFGSKRIFRSKNAW